MPKPKDYCVCTYLVNVNTKHFQGPPLKRVIDSVLFDQNATLQCLDRKEALELEGKKSVKAYILREILKKIE